MPSRATAGLPGGWVAAGDPESGGHPDRGVRAGLPDGCYRGADVGRQDRLGSSRVAGVQVHGSAPAATAAAAEPASSAGVTGTAGCSARVRLPFRQAFSVRIGPSARRPCRHAGSHPAQMPSSLPLIRDHDVGEKQEPT